MTRLLNRSCVLGLLLATASSSTGFAFAPNGNVALAVPTSTNTNTRVNVGAVFEDKPHMMIGGRGYSNLVVNMNEFALAKAAASRQRKVLAAKLLAGYTAVLCGSLLLRQMVGLLAYVPFFYKAYPLTAAVATCGIKSMLADAISQVKGFTGDWDFRRSLSGLVYGSAVLGAGSKMAYSQLLPRICPPGMAGIATSCVLDNFVLAPLIWLPGAYIVKSLFHRAPMLSAIKDYVSDIRNQGLLRNYWKLWVPAQFLNFAVVPKHLQVPFVAGVGFVWYFVLSSMAYKESE